MLVCQVLVPLGALPPSLMVFLFAGTVPVVSPISTFHGLLTPPPLFPGETTIARWNSGAPVVSGSAMVLPLIRKNILLGMVLVPDQ